MNATFNMKGKQKSNQQNPKDMIYNQPRTHIQMKHI